MRVFITFIFVVTVLGTTAEAQQSDQLFHIDDPMKGEVRVPAELLNFYDSSAKASPSQEIAPATNVVVPRTDTWTQPTGNPVAVADNFGGRPISRNSQTAGQDSFFKKVSAPMQNVVTRTTPFSKSYRSDSFARSYGGEVKNRNFFGVDREECCDEWEGLCGCSGLKANPGHWGLPWLQGLYACEEGCCGRICRKCKHHKNKCGCGTGSCGSSCGN